MADTVTIFQYTYRWHQNIFTIDEGFECPLFMLVFRSCRSDAYVCAIQENSWVCNMCFAIYNVTRRERASHMAYATAAAALRKSANASDGSVVMQTLNERP